MGACLWKLVLLCRALPWPLRRSCLAPRGTGICSRRRRARPLSQSSLPPYGGTHPPGKSQGDTGRHPKLTPLSYTALGLLRVLGAGAAGEGLGVCRWAPTNAGTAKGSHIAPGETTEVSRGRAAMVRGCLRSASASHAKRGDGQDGPQGAAESVTKGRQFSANTRLCEAALCSS